MLLGPAVIRSGEPWHSRRELIRRMRPGIARIRTPEGFGFSAGKLRDLIADGLGTVILSTEDGDVSHQQVDAEFRGRGFYDVVQEHPHIHFILALGNEPDLVGVNPPSSRRVDMYEHRFYAIRTIRLLRPEYHLPNLSWAVGMPTNLGDTRTLLSEDKWGSIGEVADILCPHLYGWFDLGRRDSGTVEFYAVIDYIRQNAWQPMYLAEVGIDDSGTDRDEKARRYLTWAELASERIRGACLWGVGDWEPNPSMELDESMARILAERMPRTDPRTRFFPQTGYSLSGDFLHYWEETGGIRMHGYPISQTIVEQGRLVQYTERSRLELHPENTPEWRVLQGHLGREVYHKLYGE